MREFYFLILIIFASTLWAFDVNGNDSSGWQIESEICTDYALIISLLNTWTLPEGSQALGLDYLPTWSSDHIIAYADNIENVIYFLDIDDGTSVYPGGWLTDSNNGFPFGVCHVPYSGNEQIHVNDFIYDGMFSKSLGDPWVEYDSQADIRGRGLDYHASMDKIFDFYTINIPGDFEWFVAIFTPGQSTGSTYELDCGGSDMYGSGCCVFPMPNGNTGIAVTFYYSPGIYFFEYPGYSGSFPYNGGAIPYDVDVSLGLAYSEERNTFFHSYSVSDVYYISELEITEEALEVHTWANIKSSF